MLANQRPQKNNALDGTDTYIDIATTSNIRPKGQFFKNYENRILKKKKKSVYLTLNCSIAYN